MALSVIPTACVTLTRNNISVDGGSCLDDFSLKLTAVTFRASINDLRVPATTRNAAIGSRHLWTLREPFFDQVDRSENRGCGKSLTAPPTDLQSQRKAVRQYTALG